MRSVFVLLAAQLVWIGTITLVAASIRADVYITSDGRVSYQVLNEHNQTVFQGGDIGAYMSGRWCVAPSSYSNTDHTANSSSQPLKLIHQEPTNGVFPVLGRYTGIRLTWRCNSSNDPTGDWIVTSFLTFERESMITFQLEYPNGAVNTTLQEDVKEQSAALATFPSFVMNRNSRNSIDIVSPLLPDTLSWEGSFVQSVRGLSTGPRGGPTVFYNAASSLETVIIGSSMGSRTLLNKNSSGLIYWNTFTAGNHYDWSRSKTSFSPGVSGRISSLPRSFQHSYMLFEGVQGSGITATMNDWGSIMQQYANVDGKFTKMSDVTLEKIGIQTDNGAFYCFCREQNCSNVLLQNKKYLDDIGIPVGYLSFQGAGTSSGRGKAAPWCVQQWSADGGQDPNHYPLDTKTFQRALGVPLQLYAPYYCPNSTYFGKEFPWQSVISNPELPGCKDFEFENVHPNDSKQFFQWFMKKGTDAGMKSFETDFMNQNVNCVGDFVRSYRAADDFLRGMADAASDLHIPIQWCYASPNEVFSSLSMPSVTNFRVSFDFCYGKSYDIGESSLLVWALGAAPSKDTVWSTDNNHTETPGCSWTPDHETIAAELHVILALMTTGPFGLSDGTGMTNATLVQRAIAKDGTLLQPIKPITAVDSTFLNTAPDGYLYGTYSVGPSWIFVSFQLKDAYPVTVKDFYPRIDHQVSPELLLAVRSFSDAECVEGDNAVHSGCIRLVTLGHDNHNNDDPVVFIAPQADFTSSPGSDLAPTVVTVWQNCECNGIFLLGELDKYVALSSKRFDALSCTEDGVSTVVTGSVGEVIEITYLAPRTNEVSGGIWYEVGKKSVDFATGDRIPIEISVHKEGTNTVK
ncbi:hypothetical protein IV203_024129 [Nitzschia inconspicua]|uniref:Uncharacterized protein n=1 Tax=Nitzschia inconspicua TaxID=303405 RepID=A0A9K3PBC8_9STRA|nr:hypothetical protein IV203_024129 [Nitzschia inconspicua]